MDGVLAWRETNTEGSPMVSSSPRRRSSSVTVTQSAGSPWLNNDVMAWKMWPCDDL
jgi:hypothetical protein